MNEIAFNREFEPTRKLFGRCSPNQVRSALKQLQRDLDDRPPEVSTGIGIGDRFARREGPREVTDWVLRPRVLNVLERMVAELDQAFHVGLVRTHLEHGETLTTWAVWAGWIPVANINDLTDQEWDRVRDSLEFTPINAGVTQ